MKRALIFFLFLPIITFAHPFWDTHSEGWHWYDDPKQKQMPEEIQSSQDPMQQMEHVQARIKRALDKAILFPTEENIRNYIDLQNRIAAQASLFSKMWRQTLLNYPILDYSLTHPTNQSGKQTYLDAQREKQNRSLQSLAKTTGFFFFFRGSCPYCHQFAPILKHLAERYGFSVLPISLDGDTLPEFPNIKPDNGISMKFHVGAVPALFAINLTTHQITPLAYGLMSEEELIEKIIALAEK